MLYAKTFDGAKVKATHSLKGKQIKVFCPFCDPLNERPLRLNCGSQKKPYFSHPPGTFCKAYGKETDWHLGWKEMVHSDECEVIIKKNGIRHIADIKNRNNLVIELQHSKISINDIWDRENFYDDMVWLFNATNPKTKEWFEKSKKRRISISLELEYDTGLDVVFYRYSWKWARLWILRTKKPLFLDLGYNLILYIPNDSSKEGYGCIITKHTFIIKVLEGKGLKKLPSYSSGFYLWIDQIRLDKKRENDFIKYIIDSGLKCVIQKDVDEQIIYNELKDEIQLSDDIFISQICADEKMFFEALQEEIELSNEICIYKIEEENLKHLGALEFPINIHISDDHNPERYRVEKILKNEVNIEKRYLQYLITFDFYDPVVVHNTFIKICDFLVEHPVYASDPRFVCEKIKLIVDNIQIAINFKLKIFSYLKKEGIISYSNKRFCWYVSNQEFTKKIRESSYHKLLERKKLLVD